MKHTEKPNKVVLDDRMIRELKVEVDAMLDYEVVDPVADQILGMYLYKTPIKLEEPLVFYDPAMNTFRMDLMQ